MMMMMIMINLFNITQIKFNFDRQNIEIKFILNFFWISGP